MNRAVGWLLAIGAVVALALTLWRGLPPIDLELMAARDTIVIRDTVRFTIRDTVTRWRHKTDTVKAASDSLDARVGIVDDSTVQISENVSESLKDSAAVFRIPPLVVADLRALRLTVATQDTLLRWWERKSGADSLAILARDKMIELQKPPRCSRKCGFLLGAVSVAGLVYLVK
jgi:hypothetical protein